MVVIITILSIACRRVKIYPSPIIYTSSDTTANFMNYHTYYIADTIAFIDGSATDTILTGSDARVITDEIKRNMNSRGFILVTRNASPDIGINTGIIGSNISVENYSTGWWVTQRGWNRSSYWGRTGTYSYPFTAPYRHSSTSLLIDLVDLQNSPSGNLGILWNAVIATGPGYSSEGSLFVGEIGQAFAQSPYLKTN